MRKDEVLTKLNEIERLLRGKDDKPLNVTQASQYLGISNSQLYKLTSQKKIPCYKPSGKYLYFFKYELDLWIRNVEDWEKRKDNSDNNTQNEDDEEPPP